MVGWVKGAQHTPTHRPNKMERDGKETIGVTNILLRGYGLQVITAWQDLAQMRSRYKLDYPTILNNAAALMSFGQSHDAAAREYAEILGVDAAELLRMGPDQAARSLRGEGIRKVRGLNYLKDEQFAGLADSNPYFARHQGRGL